MKQGIIGKELISTGDQGKFRLSLEYDKSISLDENLFTSTQVENYLNDQPEIQSVFSNIGGPSTGIGNLGVGAANKTEFTIQLISAEERNHQATEEYMQVLRENMQHQFPGINFSMASLGLIPRSAPIEITLSGPDEAELMLTAQNLKQLLKIFRDQIMYNFLLRKEILNTV